MSGNVERIDLTMRPAVATQAAAMPILAMLLVIASLLPEDLNIRPGGFLLTMPKLLLLPVLPYILVRAVGQMTRPDFKMAWSDAIMPVAAVWMFLSISMINGVDRAIVGASSLIIDFCGAYYLVRTTARGPGQVVILGRLLTYAIAVTGILGLTDVVTGRPILHDLVDVITGYNKGWRSDVRNGVVRAQSTLEHPILLGTVCSFAIVMAMKTLRGPGRAIAIVFSLIGLIVAQSSAPMLGAVAGVALLLYRRLTDAFPKRWRWLLMASGSWFAALLIVHPRPFSFLLDLTLDPATGYYRLLIWNIVGDAVMTSPWFGLGMGLNIPIDFGLSNTVDSVWLMCGVMFGIPGAVMIGMTMIGSCSQPIDNGKPNRLDADEMAMGVALSIVVFLYVFIGFTVHFWGSTWILMGVVAAMRANLGERAARSPEAA